ncbi:hypothetical protein [uncultured Jannaschia sp.]|uniref:hypothetical protein n=1 Tax=uncultured Jannaschia sp. TaxID=293347 RepID=UPI00261270C1|nr:hypothetical protein [uncultured Jannaschia sp.]
MTFKPQTFLSDDSGAVTVDWVVLTAALVGLGLAVMGVVSTGVQDISGDIDGQLKSDDIIQVAFTDGAASFEAAAAALGLDPSAEIAGMTNLTNEQIGTAVASTASAAAMSQAALDDFGAAYAAFESGTGWQTTTTTYDPILDQDVTTTTANTFSYGGQTYSDVSGVQTTADTLGAQATYDAGRATAYQNEATERGI